MQATVHNPWYAAGILEKAPIMDIAQVQWSVQGLRQTLRSILRKVTQA